MVALGLVGATSGTAFAGERAGNGEPTPVNEHIANSLCAYSGLEDFDTDEEVPGFEEDVQPGVVQNWGSGAKGGVSSLVGAPFHPGNACNGHKVPAKGGSPE